MELDDLACVFAHNMPRGISKLYTLVGTMAYMATECLQGVHYAYSWNVCPRYLRLFVVLCFAYCAVKLVKVLSCLWFGCTIYRCCSVCFVFSALRVKAIIFVVVSFEDFVMTGMEVIVAGSKFYLSGSIFCLPSCALC